MNASIRIFLKVYNVKCEFKQAKPKESFSQVYFLKSEYLLTLKSTFKVSLKMAKLFCHSKSQSQLLQYFSFTSYACLIRIFIISSFKYINK